MQSHLPICRYSYGVVLWEVLTGQQPWAGMHAMQVRPAVA